MHSRTYNISKPFALSQLTTNFSFFSFFPGIRWTAEEETFLVVGAMQGHTNAWIHDRLPGNNWRTMIAIAGHLTVMRAVGRLPSSWRARNWVNDPPYTLDEDAEIMMWHVWGRNAIDASVFVTNDRAGGSVIARADYLAQDAALVQTVDETEDGMRRLILSYDILEAESGDDDDEDAEGGYDAIAMRRAAIELRHAEDYGLARICGAIRGSLLMRSSGAPSESSGVE